MDENTHATPAPEGEPPRDLLARAERLGAARGLRRVQRDRHRSDRIVRALSAYGALWVVPVLGYAVAATFGGWWVGLGVLVGGLLVMNVVLSMLRSPETFQSMGVVAATLLAIGGLWGVFSARGESVPGSSVLVTMSLPLVAYFGVHVTGRYVPRRWAYVLAGCVGAIVAVPVSSVSAAAGALLGIVWVLAVVFTAGGAGAWWRVKRARWRSGVRAPAGFHGPGRVGLDTGGDMLDENIETGAEAELRTAAHLLDLPQTWTVLHSREVPGSRADVDHLAVGPTGVYLIDSKDWKGHIEETLIALDDPDFPEPVPVPVLDGHIDRLPERVTPALFEAGKVAQVMGLPTDLVEVVVALTGRTRMKHPMTLYLSDVPDPSTGGTRAARVHLVHAKDVAGWLQDRPAWHAPVRGWVGRLLDRARGGVSDDKAALRDRHYVQDLGALADYALPPRR